MRTPERGSRQGQAGGFGYDAKASGLQEDHSSIVVALPTAGWKTAMRRAHAIRRYKGRAKVLAVRHWRVAVVDALGVRS